MVVGVLPLPPQADLAEAVHRKAEVAAAQEDSLCLEMPSLLMQGASQDFITYFFANQHNSFLYSKTKHLYYASYIIVSYRTYLPILPYKSTKRN